MLYLDLNNFNLMVPVEALWKRVSSPLSHSLLIINYFSSLLETCLENFCYNAKWHSVGKMQLLALIIRGTVI